MGLFKKKVEKKEADGAWVRVWRKDGYGRPLMLVSWPEKDKPRPAYMWSDSNGYIRVSNKWPENMNDGDILWGGGKGVKNDCCRDV